MGSGGINSKSGDNPGKQPQVNQIGSEEHSFPGLITMEVGIEVFRTVRAPKDSLSLC